MVLMGTSMNVMTESLHLTDKALPQGLYVHPSYDTYNCGSQKTMVQLYNTKDHTIVIKKETAVAQMVAANKAPKRILTDQRKAFTSEVVEQLCPQFRSQSTTTTSHPQGNDQVE